MNDYLQTLAHAFANDNAAKIAQAISFGGSEAHWETSLGTVMVNTVSFPGKETVVYLDGDSIPIYIYRHLDKPLNDHEAITKVQGSALLIEGVLAWFERKTVTKHAEDKLRTTVDTDVLIGIIHLLQATCAGRLPHPVVQLGEEIARGLTAHARLISERSDLDPLTAIDQITEINRKIESLKGY